MNRREAVERILELANDPEIIAMVSSAPKPDYLKLARDLFITVPIKDLSKAEFEEYVGPLNREEKDDS